MKFFITSTLLTLLLATQQSQAYVEKIKHFSSFRDLSNIRIIDVDNDNKKDIVTMINNDKQRLYIVNIPSENEGIETTLTDSIKLESDNESIDSFEIYYDRRSDNHFAVVISKTQNVHLLNLTARKYVKALPNVTAEIVKFKDIDNDGDVEIMLINESSMSTLDMHTLETKAHYNLPHYEFVVGKFTNHLFNEMLTWDGKIYRIQDNEINQVGTLAVTGTYLFTKDINGDGTDEVVNRDCTIDVKNGSVIWPVGNSLESCKQEPGYSKYGRSSTFNNTLYQLNAEVFSGRGYPYALDLKYYNYLTREKEVIGKNFTEGGGDYQPKVYHHIYSYLDLYGDEKKEKIEQKTKLHVEEVLFGEITELGFNGDVYLAKQNNKLRIIDRHNTVAGINDIKWQPDYIKVTSTTLKNISPFTQNESWSKEVANNLNYYTATDLEKVSVIPFAKNSNDKIVYQIDDRMLNKKKSYILNMDGSNHIEEPIIGSFEFLGDIDGDGTPEYLHHEGFYYLNISEPFEIKDFNSDVAKYSISRVVEPTHAPGLIRSIALIDFDGDGVKELVFEHKNRATIYNLVQYSHSSLDLGDLKSLYTFTNNAIEKLYGTTQNGTLQSISAQGSKQEITTLCASSKLIDIEQHLDGQLHITCENELGTFNLTSQQYSKLVSLDMVATHADIKIIGQDTYWLVRHDNGRELYKISESTELPFQLSAAEFNTNKFTPVNFALLDEKDAFNYRFYISKAPSKGNISFSDRALGHFNYTPTTGEVGLDQFELSMTVGGKTTESVLISINIEGTPLIFESSSLSAHWRTPLNGTLSLSGIDENTVLQFGVTSAPASGEFVFSNTATGEFTYTPSTSTLEPAMLTVNVSNEHGLHIEKVITVNHTNTTPQAPPVEFEVNQSGMINVTLLAQDADSDPLIYELVSQPNKGVVEINRNTGLMSYTPENDATYEVNFQYRVFDGVSYSEPSNVTLNVDTTKADDNKDNTDKEQPKSKSGGSMPVYLLSLLLLAGFVRKLRFS
ncbi:Ig-like domain-containing protein [Pseudoalteromonas sp. XMcav11-Q]|uniref:Ig-like domain-containing protein n=1 Tax=Pseudoalteromonas sp. XMcav11-Q TaxID=3136665 RepID=UPI0032C4670F